MPVSSISVDLVHVRAYAHAIRSAPALHPSRHLPPCVYIRHAGATRIYDFDDDNALTVSSFDALERMKIYDVETQHHVYNPYPFFQPQHKGESTFVWPRGMPLSYINDPMTHNSPIAPSQTPYQQLAVARWGRLLSQLRIASQRHATRKLPVISEHL